MDPPNAGNKTKKRFNRDLVNPLCLRLIEILRQSGLTKGVHESIALIMKTELKYSDTRRDNPDFNNDGWVSNNIKEIIVKILLSPKMEKKK